jgi:hypothetical protein
MTKFISVFACALVLCVASPVVLTQKPINHGGKIETKYDGFALETVMRLRKMKVTCDGFKDNFKGGCVSIDVALHCPGTQISHVGSVTLQVIFDTKGGFNQVHDMDQRDLSIVMDTDTRRFGRMKLVSDGAKFLDETATEILETTVPYEVFKKMASAQSVEMQVGPSTIGLREKNLLALKDLHSRVITAPN